MSLGIGLVLLGAELIPLNADNHFAVFSLHITKLLTICYWSGSYYLSSFSDRIRFMALRILQASPRLLVGQEVGVTMAKTAISTT